MTEMFAFSSVKAIQQKIRVAIGECCELEVWLDILYESGKLDMAKHRNFIERVRVIRKMLYNLLKSTGWESRC